MALAHSATGGDVIGHVVPTATVRADDVVMGLVAFWKRRSFAF